MIHRVCAPSHIGPHSPESAQPAVTAVVAMWVALIISAASLLSQCHKLIALKAVQMGTNEQKKEILSLDTPRP